MRRTITILFPLLFTVSACAATAPQIKKGGPGVPPPVEAPKDAKAADAKVAKPEKKAPIIIPEAPKTVAEIDPDTLKVTYKGDPKAVVDQLVKAWAQTMGQLQQCQSQLKKEKE